MSDQATATKPVNIDNSFASSESELYAQQPFFGAISRIRTGQKAMFDYVDPKDRLTLQKWLDQKDISQGQFLLETKDANGNPIQLEFMVDKNADPETSNPFLQNIPQQQDSGMSELLKNQLESEITRLKNELDREERKRRNAEDELYKVKRDQSEGNGEIKLEHERKISRLKEDHRDKEDKLKEEIRELKNEIKFLELEHRMESGDTSFGNRLFNIIEKNLDGDFLANIASTVGELMQQQGNTQPTQQQLQAAIKQQAQATRPNPQNGQQATQAPKMNVNTGDKPAENSGEPENPQTKQQPTPKTKEQVKQEFVQGLKNAAEAALIDQNANLQKYANAVRQQMALNKQHGIKLDAGQWVEMAKMLANKAVEENVSSRRVAKVIEPVLSGVPKQYRMMLGMFDPQAAATKLFETFNIEASPQVKGVVVEVLTELKNKN